MAQREVAKWDEPRAHRARPVDPLALPQEELDLGGN